MKKKESVVLWRRPAKTLYIFLNSLENDFNYESREMNLIIFSFLESLVMPTQKAVTKTFMLSHRPKTPKTQQNKIQKQDEFNYCTDNYFYTYVKIVIIFQPDFKKNKNNF